MNEPPVSKIGQIGDLLTNYGWDLIWGLSALVAGLLMVRLFVNLIRKGLSHVPVKPAWRATLLSAVSVLRCWVENVKYWRARCGMLEKIKLRFDQEGIAFALPQHDVHLHYPDEKPDRGEGVVSTDDEHVKSD